MTRPFSPVTGGDRCVVVVLTPRPWEWSRYFRAWHRSGQEYAVCTEVSGSGGLTGVLGDPVGHNDLLLVVTDLAGMEEVARYNYARPGLPDCPVAVLLPRSGWTEDYQRRWSVARKAWAELEWPPFHEHIDPVPAGLVAWAVGWWAGREERVIVEGAQ